MQYYHPGAICPISADEDSCQRKSKETWRNANIVNEEVMVVTTD
ncbi:hypothetical protein [Sporomusa sp. KB1]|nr:hypothetical protein [Sporomusa sp. KB1]